MTKQEKALKDIKSSCDIRRRDAVADIIQTKGKNIGKSMRKAGYSQSYSITPKAFLQANKTQSMLDWLNYELEEVAKCMQKTRNKAKYKELSDSFVNLKKLNQLIGGQATERIEISPEDKAEVDKVLNNN